MPLAQIYTLEGKSDDAKRTVIETVTHALQEALGLPRENVRVLLHEMPKMNWGVSGFPVADRGKQERRHSGINKDDVSHQLIRLPSPVRAT